jgi:L-aspartate oxidase
VLRNMDGEAFMDNYHPLASLAPRDIVARAIDDQMKRRGDKHVLLDATELGTDLITSRFPNIYRTCLEKGIDMTVEPIPVVPAAHYLCGGVVTNERGMTDINRLFACGETAHTGLHGANRLASNSLLEAVVMARRAAEASLELVEGEKEPLPEVPDWDTSGVSAGEETVLISHDCEEIQRLMSDYVGIVRSDRRLERARTRVRFLREDIEKFYRWTELSAPLVELRNLVLVADLIIGHALWRKESRGLHYNRDYPRTDDINWKRDSLSSSRANLQMARF